MPKRPDLNNLTPDQKHKIQSLVQEGQMIRGLQIGVIIFATIVAIFDGRGWPAFFIGIAAAVWMQTKLPIRPAWLEKYRPEKQTEDQQ